MNKLTPTMQDALRKMAQGGEWTFWPSHGWLVKVFNKLADLGFAEALFDPTSKQWEGRMWKITEAGKLKAQSIPENIPGLKRSVPLWNGQ